MVVVIGVRMWKNVGWWKVGMWREGVSMIIGGIMRRVWGFWENWMWG